MSTGGFLGGIFGHSDNDKKEKDKEKKDDAEDSEVKVISPKTNLDDQEVSDERMMEVREKVKKLPLWRQKDIKNQLVTNIVGMRFDEAEKYLKIHGISLRIASIDHRPVMLLRGHDPDRLNVHVKGLEETIDGGFDDLGGEPYFG